MKIFKLLFLCLFISTATFAQNEIKVNPIGILFGDLSALYEKGLGENSGVEVFAGFGTDKQDVGTVEWKQTAFNLGGAYKYYFNPDMGFDKFYVGPYARFQSGKWKLDDESSNSSRFAVGLLGGYKWVSEKGILFELGFGVGRAFVNKIDDNTFGLASVTDLDFTGRLAVGYRFGGE